MQGSALKKVARQMREIYRQHGPFDQSDVRDWIEVIDSGGKETKCTWKIEEYQIAVEGLVALLVQGDVDTVLSFSACSLLVRVAPAERYGQHFVTKRPMTRKGMHGRSKSRGGACVQVRCLPHCLDNRISEKHIFLSKPPANLPFASQVPPAGDVYTTGVKKMYSPSWGTSTPAGFSLALFWHLCRRTEVSSFYDVKRCTTITIGTG